MENINREWQNADIVKPEKVGFFLGNQEVLIYTNHREMTLGYYCNARDIWFYVACDDNGDCIEVDGEVTHWMKLPEKPAVD